MKYSYGSQSGTAAFVPGCGITQIVDNKNETWTLQSIASYPAAASDYTISSVARQAGNANVLDTLFHPLTLALAIVLAGVALPAAADSLGAPETVATAATSAPAVLCSVANPFASADDLAGNPTPCALAPGALVLGAVYLQNASRVGGTALADYPLVTLRVGVVRRIQFTFDAPSEIAQSRPGGGGAFPITHLGFGFTYTIAQSNRFASAIVTEVLPPDSRFAPSHAQSHATLGLASDVAVNDRWTLGATAADTSSTNANGFGVLLPSLDVGAGYAASAQTQVVMDLGERIVSKHADAQSFTDIGVDQQLNAKWLFMVGVGTTFNAVGRSKPHYLASGFTYRP